MCKCLLTLSKLQTERQATERQMFGPVMPVESANKYQPMEQPEVSDHIAQID